MIRRSINTEEVLNDGLLEYGTVIVVRDAKKNIVSRDFVAAGTLYYKNMEIRQQDFAIHGGIGQEINKKVKTYLISNAESGIKVRINGDIYDITSADDSGNYRYWYLTRIK